MTVLPFSRIKFAAPSKSFMMKRNLTIIALFISFASFAQIRKIPTSVTEAFSRQYPRATDVSFRDQLTGYYVEFKLDSMKMTARYNNDADWKETDVETDYESLPLEVKDGFSKSKYATEWKVKESAIIQLPGNVKQYRVKIEKSELQRKYLYFSPSGRLLRDNITI
jgi:hypothetical protein